MDMPLKIMLSNSGESGYLCLVPGLKGNAFGFHHWEWCLLWICHIWPLLGWASQVVQWWRIHLPVQETQEIQVWFLGWEDPSEEEMATHSSILAWEISWTEEPGRLRSTRLQRAGHDWAYTHKTMRMRVLWIFFIKVLSSSHVWKKLIYICILCEGMSF